MHLCTMALEVEKKNYTELFYYFFGEKKQLLKALLTCTFIRSLLNSFDLPSYGSKPRKRYTLRLLCC